MDALLPAFVAVLLAETGGRMQGLVGQMGARQSGGAVLAALALSTLISLGVAVAGAAVIATMIGARPRELLSGLALLFAGVPMLLRQKPPKAIGETSGIVRSFFAFLAAQLGDASQFIVFAFAARGSAPTLAMAGGVAAVLSAGALPLILGKDWPGSLPLSSLRRIAAVLLIVAGGFIAIKALGII